MGRPLATLDRVLVLGRGIGPVPGVILRAVVSSSGVQNECEGNTHLGIAL
jgi:hypothetical protein